MKVMLILTVLTLLMAPVVHGIGAEPPPRGTIHEATERNDIPAVQRYLEEGVPVNAVDRAYRTPLHLAAQRGRTRMAAFLLEHGANVNAPDREGNTPLLSTRAPAVIELLLEHGADINAQNNLGNTLLHNSLFYPTVVELLLKNGADIDLKNNEGQTAMDRAIIAGRESIVARLISEGGDAAAPLHDAAYHGQAEVVKGFLERGADPNIRDEDGNTVLHKALMPRTASLETVQLLLEHGADVHAVNTGGQTPLHLAVRGNPYLVISVLLTDAGADVNAEDQDGMTPFLNAITRGSHYHRAYPEYPALVNLLLEQGADCDRRFRDGRTALHFAAGRRANFQVIRILAKERGLDVNERDDHGRTPLHLAAAQTHERHPENVEELITQGADVNMQDNNGQTPLHIAAGAGRLRNLYLLIQAGAEVKTEDNRGRTPLDLARERNRTEAVEVLATDR